jgi:hypothetical protein
MNLKVRNFIVDSVPDLLLDHASKNGDGKYAADQA